MRQDDLVNLQLSLNAQEIINISKLRLCNKASKETREIWYWVIDELVKIEPYLASACVPQCVYRGFCPEKNPCGRSQDGIFKLYREQYQQLNLYPSECVWNIQNIPSTNLSMVTSSTLLPAHSAYQASIPMKSWWSEVLLASDANTSEVSTKKMVSYLVESNSFKSAAYLHSS